MAAAIEIPKERREWLDDLKSLCASDMVKAKSRLREIFEGRKNCFNTVLSFIKNADFDGSEKSLAYVTLIEFEAWLKSKTERRDVQEVQQESYKPSEAQKKLALELVVSSKFLLFEPVRRIFELDSADITKHVNFLRHTKREYKEAATIAYKLNLQKDFSVEEILLPLIIIDQLPLTESYVEGSPKSLELFMKLIDCLCAMTDYHLEDLVEKTVAPKPKDHKLKKNILVKFGEKLVKKFHLNAENYPNIYKEQNAKELRDLLQSKYSEEKKLRRKWEDLIQSAIGNKKWRQLSLIEVLVEFGDIKEAAKWTKHYCLPLDSVHNSVRDFVKSRQGASEDSEDWQAEIEGKTEREVYNDISSAPASCYRLPLSADKICVVDNPQSLRECAQDLCEPGTVVGFDTEWRPKFFYAGTDDRVSIMQLSIRNKVFILDMIALADTEMQQFAESFFANPLVLKLGYGVDSDFRNLVSSCPPCKDALTRLSRFVDLCPFSEQLLRIPSVQKEVSSRMRTVSAREREEGRGLSELAFLCLGQPLDKTYQISDWERRPLSEDQLIYAATDAYCLLEIYDKFKKWDRELKLKVDMEPCVMLTWLQPKKKKERQTTRKQPKPGTASNDLLPPARKGDPISPQSLKLVVDTMLQGLGKSLRHIGIDVVILDEKVDQERAVKISQTENRIILTTCLRYEQLRAHVPEGMCVLVPSEKIQQQVSRVVKYFNLQVKEQDILSRCQACNGDELLQVHKDVMQLVVQIFHGRVKAPLPGFEPKNCPVNLKDLTLPGGVPLQLDPLPDTKSDRVAIFLCCSRCGKILWKREHPTPKILSVILRIVFLTVLVKLVVGI